MKHSIRNAVLSIAVLLATASGVASAGVLNDAAIFSIFDQANMADITTARIGIKKAHSKEVRELAQMVATDHEAVQRMGRELATKLGVTPLPPDGDTSVDSLAKAIANLDSKSGAEFDKAYLRYEIGFHQSVIDAIKGTLLPAIKDDQLKALVTKVLPGFEHHLAATKAAAKKLGLQIK